jgi:hypothetical protein
MVSVRSISARNSRLRLKTLDRFLPDEKSDRRTLNLVTTYRYHHRRMGPVGGIMSVNGGPQNVIKCDFGVDFCRPPRR